MTFSQTDFHFFSHFPFQQGLRRLGLEKMFGEGGWLLGRQSLQIPERPSFLPRKRKNLQWFFGKKHVEGFEGSKMLP